MGQAEVKQELALLPITSSPERCPPSLPSDLSEKSGPIRTGKGTGL